VGYGRIVVDGVELACGALGAWVSPEWLPMPHGDVGGALLDRLGSVQEATPEAGGSPSASFPDQVKALYLSEGLWALDQVCRRMGAPLAERDAEWLTELVMRPEFGPLRPVVALTLWTSNVPLREVPAGSIEHLIALARTCDEQCLGWAVGTGSGAGLLPGTTISLDGFVALPEFRTLVWLVSWPTTTGVEYKAVASRTDS
jgi:hypothetical protein